MQIDTTSRILFRVLIKAYVGVLYTFKTDLPYTGYTSELWVPSLGRIFQLVPSVYPLCVARTRI